MKKNSFLILLFVILGLARVTNAQTFEGIITYESQFFSKKPDLQDNTHTLKIYVKKGMVRMPSSNSMGISSYVLIKNDSSYYVNEDFNSITKDISYEPNLYNEQNKFQSVKQLQKKEKILGYSINKYKRIQNMHGMEDIATLYIADSLKTEANFGYWLYEKLGIALKIIIKSEIGTIIITAMEIKSVKLEDTFFELPGYPIKEVDMAKMSRAFIKEKGK